jgi:hypothetical protein
MLAMSAAQHRGVEAMFELHRLSRRLSKAGTAIATATLAATVVIMKNRIFSWLRVEF